MPVGGYKVAALFVEADGPYLEVPWVDLWSFERDARGYPGPLPVVAHPPCNLWGAFAAVNYARWGGEHNHPGNDGGCFSSALSSVRKYGGVLEHPAKTKAWKAHGLVKPVGIGWQPCDIGWVCEVWQSAYGHKANKATWLYCVSRNRPFRLREDRPAGTHQIGYEDSKRRGRNKPTVTRKEAIHTPPAFRDTLLKLSLQA